MKKLSKHIVEEFAKGNGFDLVAFTKPVLLPRYSVAYREWLAQGMHADMGWMEKEGPRLDLQQVLPGAQTVITLATNYYREQQPLRDGHGRVARYAYGRDYHKVVRKGLRALEKFICEAVPGAETRSYVDTGPVLERALAEQSGLGQIGKNACLITREFGSWVFLSEVFTTVDLGAEEGKAPEAPFEICGDCRMCIDACPTGAIVAPGVVDSRKCISYLTIENKGQIPEEYAKVIKRTKTMYGCDICQRVCPKNDGGVSKENQHEGLGRAIAGDQLDLEEVAGLAGREEFLDRFAGSPCVRAKLDGMKRNAQVVGGEELTRSEKSLS